MIFEMRAATPAVGKSLLKKRSGQDIAARSAVSGPALDRHCVQ